MVDGVIVLYDQNETSFTSNGLGYLPDATECTVIEELNGEFELEMEYPITGTRYDQIQHRRILYVKTNPYEDPQPFRIYNINKPIDGLVEVNARHISYDLSGYALPWISDGDGEKSKLPFATGPASAVENLPALVNQLNTGMQPFTYWTNSTEDYPRDPDPAHEKENELKEPHWIFIDTPTTARNLLGTFTEKYKGEFKFDKFNVKFYGPVSGQSEDDTHYRGKDSGVVLRYGKNLTDLMQEEDSDKGMYTHIYPFWSGSIDVQKEGSEQSTTETKETVIELADKLYPVNSNVDPGYKRIYVYDVTSDYTDELKSKDGLGHPSEETLKEMCDKLIKENKLGTPNITLTASFVQLSKSVEYSNLALLEKILLGDTVTVDFPKLDVKSTLKCTAIEYNVLTDEYKTITLGDERNTSGGVSSTIASTASLSASNSTAIAGSATKQDVYGKSYDTALSTTSENAVQNKVVTKAINNTNDAISSLKSQYSTLSREIQELIESGSKVTFGTTTPENSMGEEGNIYVKIKRSSVEERDKWHGYARNSNSASYSWFISKKKYNCEANTEVRLKGLHSKRAAQWAFVSLSPVNTGNPWECGGPTTNWYPQASELTDFDINVTINNSTANDYYIWVWIDQGNEYTIDYIDLNGREIAINDDKFVCGASYNDNISEFISDAPPEEYDEIVDVYYKHNGVWLSSSNKEVLTGTIPPEEDIGENDNVYAQISEIDKSITDLFVKSDDKWLKYNGSGGGGSSLPSGGTTGQALVKQSGTDYDADWDDIIQVPSGGTTGQVLGKISGTNYDIGWINQSGGGGGGGGSGYTEISVLSSPITTAGTYQISDISDADLLIFEVGVYFTSRNIRETFSTVVSATEFRDTTKWHLIGGLVRLAGNYEATVEIIYVDDTHIRVDNVFAQGWGDPTGIQTIKKVKFSGGGGGGSGEQSDLLYSNTSGTVPDTITLSHPYTDYERLVLTVQTPASPNAIGYDSNVYYVSDFDTINIIGGTSSESFVWYSITNSTTLTKVDATRGHYIKSIHGIKPSSGGGGSGSDDYSTTETRIGTWINGKPLYRKVITGTLNAVSAGVVYEDNVSHGISNIDAILMISGGLTRANGSLISFGYTAPYNSSQNYFVSVNCNRTELLFRVSSGFETQPFTAILEYTKTTD